MFIFFYFQLLPFLWWYIFFWLFSFPSFLNILFTFSVHLLFTSLHMSFFPISLLSFFFCHSVLQILFLFIAYSGNPSQLVNSQCNKMEKYSRKKKWKGNYRLIVYSRNKLNQFWRFINLDTNSKNTLKYNYNKWWQIIRKGIDLKMSFGSNKNKNWILKTESVIEDSPNK